MQRKRKAIFGRVLQILHFSLLNDRVKEKIHFAFISSYQKVYSLDGLYGFALTILCKGRGKKAFLLWGGKGLFQGSGILFQRGGTPKKEYGFISGIKNKKTDAKIPKSSIIAFLL